MVNKVYLDLAKLEGSRASTRPSSDKKKKDLSLPTVALLPHWILLFLLGPMSRFSRYASVAHSDA